MAVRRSVIKSDMTYKTIAALIVLLIPIIGLIVLMSLSEMWDMLFWLGILLIMFFTIGVSVNILRYKGNL
jgi:hypothetical protein